MRLHTMEMIFSEIAIEFRFNLAYRDRLDLATFITGVLLKFDGTTGRPYRFTYKPGKVFGAVRVTFSDRADFLDARDYCRNHLTATGRVSARYRGALERIDPGRRLSGKLLARITRARRMS